MSDPSSRGRALLDAARAARPTDAARSRIGAALSARIGVAAPGDALPTGAEAKKSPLVKEAPPAGALRLRDGRGPVRQCRP